MVLYPYTITHTGINLNRAIAWRNMIRDGRITEIQKEKFDDDIVEKVFYVINGKIIPYIEGGIFYGPNDGKDDWPSYCAVDILKREYNGWAIYEVKSSTVNKKI